MSEALHDTIVALATAPGRGAVAVVRVSGPGAATIRVAVAPALGDDPPARVARLVSIVDPASGEEVDRALAIWFPGPASYTGEDVLEISGHGGMLAPTLVEAACVAAGARRAERGEFTRRALLAGKLDLIQAEAIADLVDARSRALHRAALRQLDGGLSRRITELRRGLVELEALLVHHLDFPEEDDAPVPTAGIARRADELAERVERLLVTAPEGELLRSGALVVLAGRPNSGKSSLFNALLGESRALVTEVPGTTRDALEAEIQLGGFPFRLVDTAGLRESEERIERLGIEVARRYLRAADVVLFCIERGRAPDGDERAFLAELAERGIPVVLVVTKADREAGGPERPGSGNVKGAVGLPVSTSALDGTGLGEVADRLTELVYGGLVEIGLESPVVTRERQARALERGRDEVRAFAAGLRDGIPAEVVGTHLRSAESALEEVVGVLSPDEVLDHLFSSFCIGK